MTHQLRRLLFLAGAVILPAFAAQAQQPSPPRPAAGPRIDATAAAFQRATSDAETLMLQSRTNNVGKPIALMVVGGAAIILGLVAIEGDVGTLFAIGGAVALLYGLYLYLK